LKVIARAPHNDQGQLGKRQREQVVQLVDEPSALANDGLQAAGDLAEHAQLVGERRHGGGPFDHGEAGGGAGLDGIGLLAAEVGGAVVLVALRIADREDDRQRLSQPSDEADQIVGVLPGDVDADDEAHVGAGGSGSLKDEFDPATELFVTGGGLGEGEFVGGGLKVVAQERGVVSVARHIDADAEGSWSGWCAGAVWGWERLRRDGGFE
jgi:hypothetical protein